MAMTAMSFLAFFIDGGGHIGYFEPLLSYEGMIIPLPRRSMEFVEQINFFKFVRSSGLDAHML